jgi:hypothetical protein
MAKRTKDAKPKAPFSTVAQTVGFSLRTSKMLDLSMGID